MSNILGLREIRAVDGSSYKLYRLDGFYYVSHKTTEVLRKIKLENKAAADRVLANNDRLLVEHINQLLIGGKLSRSPNYSESVLARRRIAR